MNHKHQTNETRIPQLKRDILSNDWETAFHAANQLAIIGKEDTINYLISLLKSPQPNLRNVVALTLAEAKEHRAVEPLLESIFKEENYHHNGTMVYALTYLDCSKKLKEIFNILFHGNYEAKVTACAILSEQVFDFMEEDLHHIQQMWELCQTQPEKCSCSSDEELKRVIQHMVEGFMSYLND